MTEEILTYNTPNSEQILRQINQYEFKRIWENNLKKNNKNLFWTVFFLLLAGFMLFYKEHLGYFFAGLGLMYISIFINYRSIYRKQKEKLNTLLDKEIKDLTTNSKDVIWEFTPTYFRFKNYKSDFKFNWETISYCLLDDQYLYITASPYMNFILDKANIDEENFNKTIDYLKNKSQFKAV